MKHINSLLQALIPSSHTPFEQKLLSGSLMSSGAVISMSDILFLIECFEGYGPECNGVYLSGAEYIGQFFRLATSKTQNGLVAIKLCLTLHLILYEFQVGDCVAEAMMQFALPRSNPKDTFHAYICNYSVYLMKVAQGLKVFYAAKVGQYPPLEQEGQLLLKSQQSQQPLKADKQRQHQAQNFMHMRKQSKFSVNNLYFQEYQQQNIEKQYFVMPGLITNHQKTLFLFKLHNLTNTALQLLKQSIEQLKAMPLTKMKDSEDISHLFIEMSCVLWNDIMVMYKFSGQEINKLLDTFRSHDTHILLSTQQLYHSMIDITAKLKWVYVIRHVFDVQKIVRRPFWFEENRKLTADLEDALIDIKVGAGRLPEPTNRIMKQVPFSTRNSSRQQFQFPVADRVHPLSPQQKSHLRIDSVVKKQLFFKKFSGGIFDEECEYMSPRMLLNQFESNKQQESTLTSNKIYE